ncbi:MAG: secretin N-terminal domain-containing protein, partial [Pirellulales bacterium]
DLVKIATMEQERPLAEAGATEAITQAFALAHVPPLRLAELIKPFLTTPGANTITLDDQRVLIVTDYANNLRKIAQLIETIDKAGPEVTLEFYTVQHVEAPTLQKQISEVLAARISAAASVAAANTKLQITPDERTNQLMLVGTPTQVREARELAEALDVPLGLATEVYTFQFVEASRIDRLIRDLFDPLTIKRLYRGAIDQEDNLLIVSATPMIHEKIEWLKSSMDVESKRPGSAVQFYRLKYANAAEVLQTIQSIQQSGNMFDPGSSRGVSPLGRGRWNDNKYSQPTGYQDRTVPGPNAPAVPGATEPTPPPALQPSPEQQPIATTSNAKPDESAGGLLAGAAQVTADAISNTIIVVADRAVQQVYADLITYLDRRRPQVMIEARVVIIDTSDDFSLGIELSAREGLGLKNVIQFT